MSLYPFFNVARLIVLDVNAFRAWHLTLPYEVKTGDVGDLLVTVACEAENVDRLVDDVKQIPKKIVTVLGFLYEDGSLLGEHEVTSKCIGFPRRDEKNVEPGDMFPSERDEYGEYFKVARVDIGDMPSFVKWSAALPFKIRVGNTNKFSVRVLCTSAPNVELLRKAIWDTNAFEVLDIYLDGASHQPLRDQGGVWYKVARIKIHDMDAFLAFIMTIAYEIIDHDSSNNFTTLCTRAKEIAELHNMVKFMDKSMAEVIGFYYSDGSLYSTMEIPPQSSIMGSLVREDGKKQQSKVLSGYTVDDHLASYMEDHSVEANYKPSKPNTTGMLYKVARVDIQNKDAFEAFLTTLDYEVVMRDTNGTQTTLCTFLKDVLSLCRDVAYVEKVLGLYCSDGSLVDQSSITLKPMGCVLVEGPTPPPWIAVVRLWIHDEDFFMAFSMSLGFDIISAYASNGRVTLCTHTSNVDTLCNYVKKLGDSVASVVGYYYADGTLNPTKGMYTGCYLSKLTEVEEDEKMEVDDDKDAFFRDLKTLGIGLPGSPYLNTLGCRLCVLNDATYECDPCGCVAFCEEHLHVYLQTRWKTRCPTCCQEGITFKAWDGGFHYDDAMDCDNSEEDEKGYSSS